MASSSFILAELMDICAEFAPLKLAETWDNVGLLVGDPESSVSSVMTCLTINGAVVEEAIAKKVNVILTHHPLPFKPLKSITTLTPEGRNLLKLIRHGIAVYSAHTAFDSAAEGINQQIAEGLGLRDIAILQAIPNQPSQGSGRWGKLPQSQPLREVLPRIKQFFGVSELMVCADLEKPIQSIAIACGSGGTFLGQAHRKGCDLFLTGEANYHTALEAQALGISLATCGHFASERFAQIRLAKMLGNQLPEGIQVFASENDKDPWKYEG